MILYSANTLSKLTNVITDREKSFLNSHMEENFEYFSSRLHNKRLLIFGAAGFIAQQTIKECLRYNLKEIILIDNNENAMTELIRELNDLKFDCKIPIINPIILDIKENFADLLYKEIGPVDLVWNFAANKHVRTQRNLISILTLLQVNVLGTLNIIEFIKKNPSVETFFSISTDKASNPTSVMGASKRIMEHLLFYESPTSSSSTRFANVAFSSGSLLAGWLTRLASHKPVSVPEGVARYIISAEEAGHLCISAALFPENQKILVPNENVIGGLKELEPMLLKVLSYFNLKPIFVKYEHEIKNLRNSLQSNEIIVVKSKLDTQGENTFEEFVDSSELLLPYSDLLNTINATPLKNDLIFKLVNLVSKSETTTTNIFEVLVDILPNFKIENFKPSLDHRI